MMSIEKIEEINELQTAIESHGVLSKDVLNKINYKLRLEWNFTSNSMEGNSLTKQETRSVMVGNITIGGKPIKDVLEIKGHDEVILDIIKIGKGELNISEKRIKEIHKGIMHEDDLEKKIQIGEWKKVNNYLHNYKNERFDFTAPENVSYEMHRLINWVNVEKDKIKRNDKNALHPFELAFKFHLDYITIHPFYDGNGRTVRILTNLILISYGYPPLYIKLNEKDIYYQYLADIQGYGGSPNLFYDFMAGKLIRSLQIVLDAIAGKDISEEDDIDKEIALLKAKIDKEDVLQISQGPSVIADLIEYNLFPLFSLIEQKCIQLKDLFFDTKRRLTYENTETSTFLLIGDENSSWNEIIQNWLDNIVRSGKQKIVRVVYQFNLTGFKKNINGDSLWLKVEVYFNKYNYTIKSNKGEVNLIIPYGKTFSATELRGITTPLIKEIIEEIKRITQTD